MTTQAFVFRSSDMMTRIRVDIKYGTGDPSRPYTLKFHNLALHDRGGSKPVELKHGSSGYIWIDGGKDALQFTDVGPKFTIFDYTKKSVFSVTLLDHVESDGDSHAAKPRKADFPNFSNDDSPPQSRKTKVVAPKATKSNV